MNSWVIILNRPVFVWTFCTSWRRNIWQTCHRILNEVKDIGLNIRQEAGRAQNIVLSARSAQRRNNHNLKKPHFSAARPEVQTVRRRRLLKQQLAHSGHAPPGRESPRDVRRELAGEMLQRSCKGEVLAVQRRIGRLRTELNLLQNVLQGVWLHFYFVGLVSYCGGD